MHEEDQGARLEGDALARVETALWDRRGCLP